MSASKHPDLRYTKTHEWFSFQGKEAVCGITEHAQAILGDVTFVEFPAPGTSVKAGTKIMGLESSKAVSDIYAPLDGKISSVNENLKHNPGLINSSPLAEGWLFKLHCDTEPKLADFMDENTYMEFIKDA